MLELFTKTGEWRTPTDEEVEAEKFTPERAARWRDLKAAASALLSGGGELREAQHRVANAEAAFKYTTARLNTLRPKRTFMDEWRDSIGTQKHFG